MTAGLAAWPWVEIPVKDGEELSAVPLHLNIPHLHSHDTGRFFSGLPAEQLDVIRRFFQGCAVAALAHDDLRDKFT